MGLSVWRETSKKLTVCREKGKKLTVCRDYFCLDNRVVCRGSQWGKRVFVTPPLRPSFNSSVVKPNQSNRCGQSQQTQTIQ